MQQHSTLSAINLVLVVLLSLLTLPALPILGAVKIGPIEAISGPRHRTIRCIAVLQQY